MKNCPKCGTQCDDGAAFCNNCGASFDGGAANAQAADASDCTAEFDREDISANKVISYSEASKYVTDIRWLILCNEEKTDHSFLYIDRVGASEDDL